ncbi:unnamed protein product, partial [Ectocarpus fasciculatus]
MQCSRKLEASFAGWSKSHSSGCSWRVKQVRVSQRSKPSRAHAKKQVRTRVHDTLSNSALARHYRCRRLLRSSSPPDRSRTELSRSFGSGGVKNRGDFEPSPPGAPTFPHLGPTYATHLAQVTQRTVWTEVRGLV